MAISLGRPSRLDDATSSLMDVVEERSMTEVIHTKNFEKMIAPYNTPSRVISSPMGSKDMMVKSCMKGCFMNGWRVEMPRPKGRAIANLAIMCDNSVLEKNMRTKRYASSIPSFVKSRVSMRGRATT